MQTKFWVRRAILAIVWAFTVSTWASIGHHLLGLPDIGPALVIGTLAVILARPTGRMGSQILISNRAKTAVRANSPTA
jgi:hypothetical protein